MAGFTSLQLSRQWAAILGELELGVTPAVYETWFKQTKLVAHSEGHLTVEAPSPMICEFLSDRLRHVIHLAAAKKGVDVQHLEFVPRGVYRSNGDLSPSFATHSRHEVIGQLAPGLSMDRYLRFEGNEVALQSALELLSNDEDRPVLVCVWGQPGLGKTHMLQAVCHQAVQLGLRVAVLTADDFTNRFTGALRQKEMDRFQEELRGVDLLAIDDYQRLAGRDKTQEELAGTIEALTQLGRRVLLAGESHPRDCGLGERLRGRLLGGVVVEVESLSELERRCFVVDYARKSGQSLPVWAIERLAASSICVRSLQGATRTALKLQASGRLTPERLDTQVTASAVIEFPQARRESPVELIARVASVFDVDVGHLAGREKRKVYQDARAVASFLLHRQGLSAPAIGVLLGGRERTTIRGLIERGESMVSADPTLAARIGA